LAGFALHVTSAGIAVNWKLRYAKENAQNSHSKEMSGAVGVMNRHARDGVPCPTARPCSPGLHPRGSSPATPGEQVNTTARPVKNPTSVLWFRRPAPAVHLIGSLDT